MLSKLLIKKILIKWSRKWELRTGYSIIKQLILKTIYGSFNAGALHLIWEKNMSRTCACNSIIYIHASFMSPTKLKCWMTNTGNYNVGCTLKAHAKRIGLEFASNFYQKFARMGTKLSINQNNTNLAHLEEILKDVHWKGSVQLISLIILWDRISDQTIFFCLLHYSLGFQTLHFYTTTLFKKCFSEFSFLKKFKRGKLTHIPQT